jgi:hypothetical protein
MPGSIQRNQLVRCFGTPDATQGSVNEPRESVENGFHFNEKWIYKHPVNDPAGAAERVIYWRRYDYLGSMIRRGNQSDWEIDTSLADVLDRAGAESHGAADSEAKIASR